MRKIILNPAQRQVLAAHAKKEMPNEACAILYCAPGKNITTDIRITRNMQESPTNFGISADETRLAYEAAENTGMEILGIFHSHPHSRPLPSETDMRFMRVNPVVWVIYSPQYDEFAAFELDSDLKPVAVEILKD